MTQNNLAARTDEPQGGDSAAVAELRPTDRFSKVLFGNRNRLAAAAQIASMSDDQIYARQLAHALDISDSRAAAELWTLAQAGLLQRLPRTQREVRYERQRSPFWKFAREMADALGGDDRLSPSVESAHERTSTRHGGANRVDASERPAQKIVATAQGSAKRSSLQTPRRAGDSQLIVEVKSTDWDAITPSNRGRTIRRHARQLLSYLTEAARHSDTVQLVVTYPRKPRDPHLATAVEREFHDHGISILWTSDDETEQAAAQQTVTAYCVRDRQKVRMLEPVQVTMKNGRPAIQGRCPTCGTRLFKIGRLEE